MRGDGPPPNGGTEGPAVLLEEVSVRAGGAGILHAVSLKVARGEFLGVVGPNGSGKTTLLRLVAGTLAPTAGRVFVDGRPVAALPPRVRARRVAAVPQIGGTPPGFTVEEAVLMGRTPHLPRWGPVGRDDRRHTAAALRRAHVDHLRHRLLDTLSGGERQRVLIARALAQQATLLLLDEPTAHLDIAVQLEIMDLLAELNQGGLTLIAAFHDLNLAAAYAARLLLLERGRVAALGPPGEVLTPEALRRVYGAAAVVRPHPVTRRPHVTVVGRRPQDGEGIPWTTMAEQARRMIVAIDGPMGSGKSTVAQGVAQRLGFRYVNTGWMYRAVAREALRRGASPDDGAALADIARSLTFEFRETVHGTRLFVGGEDVTDELGAPEVSEAASRVSTHPPVREELVARQRRIGAAGAVVMEGRDIGTVVFPDAEVKVFLNATPEERARRRHDELHRRGVEVSFEELRAAEEERDRRDRERPHSPLRVAPDAMVIDTTGQTPAQVVEHVLAICRRRADVV